jgi:DNA-binding MarR family transcriptional regulator
MSDIAKELDFQAATITRNVSNLSEWTYQKEKGLGLVKMDYDPMDQRRKLVTLTGKGRTFVATLKEKLDGN